MKSYSSQILFREYFEGVLGAVFLALFLRFFVVSILFMPTESMQPTLEKGDYVFGLRIAYGLPLPLMRGERLSPKLPARGDVVSFRFPGDEEQILIRRVVGLPGDQIEMMGGILRVNGSPVSQLLEGGSARERFPGRSTYRVRTRESLAFGPFTVPADHFFVLSDLREVRDDSRDWGAVPVRNLESRLQSIWLSLEPGQGLPKVRWQRMWRQLR